MRTEEPRPVRLSEYRPPDWLVETVDLDVKLHPTRTPVRATLQLKPNPAAGAAGPARARRRGAHAWSRSRSMARRCADDGYVATPDGLTIAQPPHRPFTLEIETLVDPQANTQLSGLYRSSGNYCTQCEAEGFRRITYFPDRPDVMAVYTTRIEADKAEAPVLLSNGNLRRKRRSARTAAISRSGTIHGPKPSYLFALVGGKLGYIEDSFVTAVGPQGRAPHLCRARQGGPRRLRHGFAQALDALGRDGVRPRIRSRRLHDRRGVRLQHGRDGEQGPQRLQRQVRAGLARDRDRQRFRLDRGRSSRTNISTTGPATASPAATGSSFA